MVRESEGKQQPDGSTTFSSWIDLDPTPTTSHPRHLAAETRRALAAVTLTCFCVYRRGAVTAFCSAGPVSGRGVIRCIGDQWRGLQGMRSRSFSGSASAPRTASWSEGRRSRRLVLNDSDGFAFHDFPQSIREQVREVETDREQVTAETCNVVPDVLAAPVL